jgi:hypothetical protein
VLSVLVERRRRGWRPSLMRLDGKYVLVVHPLGLSSTNNSRTASSASPVVSSERAEREGNTHEPTVDVLDLDSEFGHLQIEREVVVVRS